MNKVYNKYNVINMIIQLLKDELRLSYLLVKDTDNTSNRIGEAGPEIVYCNLIKVLLLEEDIPGKIKKISCTVNSDLSIKEYEFINTENSKIDKFEIDITYL